LTRFDGFKKKAENFSVKLNNAKESDMRRELINAFFILGFTGILRAHPPSEIKLQFDPVKRILDITAFHDVNDSTKHYIERILVELNGEETIKQVFLQQTDRNEQHVFYLMIDAKPGDEISVNAKCNRFGDKTQTIKIAKP
jgi:hypothetical protein